MSKANDKKYTLNSNNIIVSPWVTEKSSILASENKYVFLVDVTANKPEIEKAIVNLYKVRPIKINIMNIKGKAVSRGGKITGRKKDIRKAIVTLKKGDKIDLLG
jgi:large subunit ribosomal protein L23